MPRVVDDEIQPTPEEEQDSKILDLLRRYAAGLQDLTEAEFGFALLGRLFAVANGASDAVIFAIVNKATAQTYITNLDQWGALQAAVRQWLSLELEVLAYVIMIIRAVLLTAEKSPVQRDRAPDRR
jgi:hypothetical protein